MSERTTEILDFLFEYGLDLRGRRVFLHWPMEGGGDDESFLAPGQGPCEQVIRGLLQLDKTTGAGDGHIELWINTPGGLVTEMFAIYDVIRSLDNDVWTVGFGEVCSAGCLLLVSGDRRFATPNCAFMSHDCSDELIGEISVIEARLRESRRQWTRWAKLMAKHTAHTQKWWQTIHDEKRELWLDSDQMKAKGMGIIDGIWPEDRPGD